VRIICIFLDVQVRVDRRAQAVDDAFDGQSGERTVPYGFQFLDAVVSDEEEVPAGGRMCVDGERQLREDGEPDILWSKDEVVMAAARRPLREAWMLRVGRSLLLVVLGPVLGL